MQNFDIVGALALFTIGAVLMFGIVSWLRAKKAKDHHEGAAVADRQRMEDRAASRDAPRDVRSGDQTLPTDSGRTWSQERGANPPTPSVTKRD